MIELHAARRGGSAAAAALAIAGGLLVAFMPEQSMILIGLACLAAIFSLVGKTSPLLMLAFVYTAVEGQVRSTFGGALWVYAVRDGLLIAVYAKWILPRIVRRERLLPRTPLDAALFTYVGINVVQMLNPNLPGILVSLGGAEQRLLGIPLFWMAYELANRTSRVRGWLVGIVTVSAAVASITLLQAAVGPDRSAALGLPYKYDEATASRPFQTKEFIYYRPFATTISVQQVADFSVAGALLAPAIGSMTKPPVPLALFVSIGALAVVLTRAQWIGVALALATMAFLSSRKRVTAGTAAGLAGVIAAPIVLFTAGIFVDQAIGARAESLRDPITAFVRDRAPFLGLALEYAARYPFGLGLRGGSGGYQFYNQWYPGLLQLEGHNYYTTLVGELSVLGLIAFMWVVVSLLRIGLSLVRGAKERSVVLIGIAILGYLVSVLAINVSTTSLDAAPFNLYFWFLSGIMVRLAVENRRLHAERSRVDAFATPLR